METIISKEAINYEPTWTPEQLKNAVINKLLDYGYTVANNESDLEGLSTGDTQKLEFESYLPDYSWDGLTVYITEHYNDADSIDYVYSVDVRF